MKQVQITSRGIPSKPRSQYRTGGTTTTIMGGSGTDVDLSAYMLLSRWLENFEERTDASGTPYLYAKKSIVSVGGITMYATEDVVVPSIFDGIPLDNKTIWKNPTTGKIEVIGGSGSSFDKSAMWTALAGSTTEQINKSHLTTALTGYATESWVSGKNYAVKATTLAGYGITDAYTKTESDSKYPTKTGSGASGTWGINVTGNAGSATKLQTARTLWGQSFNGQRNISGIIDSCTRLRNSSNNPLYLGNSDNTSYVFTQDIVSHDGLDKWVILSRGVAWFKNVNIGYIYENSGSHELNVNGVISAKSYSGNGVRIECDNDGNNSESRANEINSYTGGINIQYDTSGNVSLCVGGGNVGVGEERPSVKLHVSGNILATGGCTFYGSDIRYKSIMQQVNLSLFDISKAPSFVYCWNKKGMKRDRLNLGGSAQYTQSVLPWAVEENDNFLSMDYATVAYTFAVHTARHLLTYETRTDKKIKKLENRVKYLEKQLKKLGYEEVRTLDDQSV